MRLPLVHKDVDSAIWKKEELRKSTKFRYLLRSLTCIADCSPSARC